MNLAEIRERHVRELKEESDRREAVFNAAAQALAIAKQELKDAEGAYYAAFESFNHARAEYVVVRDAFSSRCDCGEGETPEQRSEREKIAQLLGVPLELIHRFDVAPSPTKGDDE